MVISDGLRDQYHALVKAFNKEDKKEIDRLGSRESEGYRGQIEEIAICSRRKVENCQKRRARRSSEIFRKLSACSLVLTLSQPKGKRNFLI